MTTWKLTWHGLATVTALELRQRVRSRRWFVGLALWFVLIGGMTALVIGAMPVLFGNNSQNSPGPFAFGLITFFVLGMGLVIAPAFTATSINGDRNAGVLALLQATRLSPLEIAAGKLAAAVTTAAVFLLVALPFIVWTMVLGNISALQVLVCFAVVFVEVAVVCAVGLGWSALVGRPAGSTMLTYLTVVVLALILPIAMALAIPLTRSNDTVRVWGLPPDVQNQYYAELDRYWGKADGPTDTFPVPPFEQCAWREVTHLRDHPERVWWLLVPNPFVVVADAAPLPPDAASNLGDYLGRSSDPLAMIRYGVRAMSQAPAHERDECLALYGGVPGYRLITDQQGNVISVETEGGSPVPVETPVRARPVTADTPLWPWGLGVNLLVGAGFFVVAVRRLTIPYGVLPRGTRVA